MSDWPFSDPRNVAVFTTRSVVKDGMAILYVTHDADDGSWQFHHDDHPDLAQAMLVSLESMVERDPTLAQIADLPEGWTATRKAPNENWHRQKKP